YISSATKVNKAIRYHGGAAEYWTIKEDLTPRASEIISRTIAAMYVSNFAAYHKLVPSAFNPPKAAARVSITDWYSLELLSQKGKVALGDLLFLNPLYKRGVIPDTRDTFTLFLPASLKDSASF